MRKTTLIVATAILILAAARAGAQITAINTVIPGAKASVIAGDLTGNLWGVNNGILSVVTFPDQKVLTSTLPGGPTTTYSLAAGPFDEMFVASTNHTVFEYVYDGSEKLVTIIQTDPTDPPFQTIFRGPGSEMRTVGCDLTAGCTFTIIDGGKVVGTFKAETTPGLNLFIGNCVSGFNGDAYCSDIEASNGGTVSTIRRFGTGGDSTAFPHTTGIVDKIVIGPDAVPWYTWYGSSGNGIGRFNPFAPTDPFIDYVRNGPKITGLTVGPDDDLYFIDQSALLGQAIVNSTGDGGPPTINTATLSVPSPEALVPVRSADGNATDPCPSPQFGVAGGGSSNPNVIYLVTVFAPSSCTHLEPLAQIERGTGNLHAGCFVTPRSTLDNLPGPAETPVMTIDGLDPSALELLKKNGWTSCGAQGPSYQCTGPTMTPGETFDLIVQILAALGEPTTVSCTSPTPDTNARRFIPIGDLLTSVQADIGKHAPIDVETRGSH
jgi:hypothetical protein